MRSLPLITRACELYDFYQKEKPHLGYKGIETFGIRYLAQTQSVAYMEDIPFLSGLFYQDNNARTLSDAFFLDSDPMTEFHLYYVYCQLNKNLGRIGSAFKTLEKLAGCLERTEKLNPKTAYGGVQNSENSQRSEALARARKLVQGEFLIVGRSGILKEDSDGELSYDIGRYGYEVLIYYITRITVCFYLRSYNDAFTSMIDAFRCLEVVHRWKLPNFDYKKVMTLERDLLSIACEVMVNYAQDTLAKEVIDIALYRIDVALKVYKTRYI